MSQERYSSPRAVEAAIKSAAQKAHAEDPSLDVAERIRLEYFDRFLSRIFASPDDDRWVLKGGASLLARVASARSTTDIDLLRRGVTLDAGVEELRKQAETEIDDLFMFEYVGRTTALEGTQQVYTEGCRVTFDVYIGATGKGSIHVDLVVGAVITDETESRRPAHSLGIQRLPHASDYRLYPLTDQIADKVCATLSLYQGRPSSREKDLVDLVLIATTQSIAGERLERALTREAAVRGLVLPEHFTVPGSWGPRYAKLAKSVPACRDHTDVHVAQDLVRQLIDPAVARLTASARWHPESLAWTGTQSSTAG